LVEFTSAVGALGAAVEFQQAMADANRDQPADAAMVFRIGVNLGDLIDDDDDIYGDDVNIAVRLEAQAPPGGIVVSRTVHEAVAGRLKATFEDLGSPGTQEYRTSDSGISSRMGVCRLAGFRASDDREPNAD
jgi:Adenylate cyclase, family 3 (some proteins contain HAMP domain)